MNNEELKPVMVAPAGLIEAGKTYLFQSIESDDGNFYDRENVDNYVNQLREENEQLKKVIKRALELATLSDNLSAEILDNCEHEVEYEYRANILSDQISTAKEGE